MLYLSYMERVLATGDVASSKDYEKIRNQIKGWSMPGAIMSLLWAEQRCCPRNGIFFRSKGEAIRYLEKQAESRGYVPPSLT